MTNTVEIWTDRLNKALWDAVWFPATVAELKRTNPDAETLKAICYELTREKAKSKDWAYFHMHVHHLSMMTCKAKAAATDGRSAA